jgi:hypothetical protein
MAVEEGESKEKKLGTLERAWAEFRAGRLNDAISRIFLAVLAVAAIVLAAHESHEVIGGALVGAAVAFGLGAAFFDRVEELSPQGVKVRQKLEKLEEAAERELGDVDPLEREEVIAKGTELILSGSRKGEMISADSALEVAKREWEYNGLAVEYRFANWLASHGWNVNEAERFVGIGRPDLAAEREGRRIGVEVKVGRRPLGAAVIDQVVGLAASVEATLPEDSAERDVLPVLVMRGIAMTAAARQRAEAAGISVYEMDEEGEIRHSIGPELE